jgi:hypothetical protein
LREVKMKIKIKCILVMTLLIGSGTIVVADWAPGDGHKMHYPQLPDQHGWDVDWGYWYLGDDWECSECGPVNDIHFWYSWYYDTVLDIPNIHVSIWSNYDTPNYSMPRQMLWNRTFYPDDFVIAGPWYGEQGWYNPYFGWWYEYNHEKYYQINIMDIEDPFKQKADEIYWLVIKMPFYYNVIGWKTSKSEQFRDTAVYGWPGNWNPIYDPITGAKMDFAFVITGEEGNNPPTGPVITGPVEGEIGIPYTYTFISTDPDGDQVSYLIDWDDGTPMVWSAYQASGLPYDATHTWTVPGTYVIQAKARDDTCGAEGPWVSYQIKMPKDKEINRPFVQFLMSHPNMFPMLQKLLQYLGL